MTTIDSQLVKCPVCGSIDSYPWKELRREDGKVDISKVKAIQFDIYMRAEMQGFFDHCPACGHKLQDDEMRLEKQILK